jgi:hypothetical protein
MIRMAILTLALWLPLWGISAGAGELQTTTINDQEGVEVTVYNSNVGLVKDLRNIRLGKGLQELRFMDVSAQIIPTSVSIRSVSHPDSLAVLEQNYEYDLLNPRKLIDKYVNKEVKLFTRNYYTDKEEIVTATILANNDGTPVYRIGNEITFGHPGRLIFPEIPENLIAKPTLLWLLESSDATRQKIEALYLTNGINWQADYVLLLNAKDTAADLSGWVTITNRSGATYNNTKLKLVAGDIHRVQADVGIARRYRAEEMKTMAAPAPQFKEQAFFEYHIYDLQRRTTIKDNQTKQISLLDAGNVPVKKEFLYRGATHYYQTRYTDKITTEKVAVFVEMQNRKEQNLGIPLPKGTVRVYKSDNDGSLQFIGEDAIDHIPKDEKVRIKLGNAFDIAAERKQTHWEKIERNTYEVAFEISLRNHKKEDVVVKVVEPMMGDWRILDSSLAYKKEDAFTVSFSVPVPKDKEVKLTYRARLRF